MNFNSKALSTFLAISAMTAAASSDIESIDSYGYSWMFSSPGNFMDCSQNNKIAQPTIVTGLCGTGENARCNDRSFNEYNTAIACGEYPASIDAAPSGSMLVATTVASDTEGWICGKSGDQKTCPSGTVMTGACGSAKSDSCKAQCASTSTFAIRCQATNNDYKIQDPGIDYGWLDAQGYGVLNTCPEGKVACGACLSGKDNDCNGQSARLRCCTAAYSPPVTFDDYEGSWATAAINGAKTFSAGVSWSQSESTTYDNSFSYGFTEGAEATFGVAKVSSSSTQQWSSSISNSVGQSTSYQYGMSCTGSCDSGTLFQWQTTSTGSDSPKDVQTNKSCGFQCVPSWISGNDNLPKCPLGFCADDAYCQCCNGFWKDGDDTPEGNLIWEGATDSQGNSLGGTCKTPVPATPAPTSS